MSTGKAQSKLSASPAVKAKKVIKLFDDLTEETYYVNNFRAALYESSDEFIETLSQFVEQCKNDRVGNGQTNSKE